ncbi:MAG TPA: hypothetical protein VF145_07550, partial [Chitinophagaceae bacterium]
ASLLTLLNLRFHWFDEVFMFWNIFGGVAFLLMLAKLVRNLLFKPVAKVKTYTSDLFSKLNAGFFVSLIFIIVAINVGARFVYDLTASGSASGAFVNIGFALLINLYAFWILVYGSALNFRPSVIGAYVSWALGFTAMFVNQFQWVMALHATAVLAGYIIPGHIANNEFKKVRSKVNV